MNALEWVKNKIFGISGNQPVNENVERDLFISDTDEVAMQNAKQCKIWYGGNANDLLSYYTEFEMKGWAKNPIYNRNLRNSFWGLSASECKIKRVHSGLPRKLIDKISEIVGDCNFETKEKPRLNKIFEFNNFNFKVRQYGRPMTLAQGWGAYKIDVNPKFKHPIIEYYEAENVKYICECGLITGFIFIHKYEYKSKKFVEYELRYVDYDKNGSVIDYYIFEKVSDTQLKPATYKDAGLKEKEGKIIEGLLEPLAVESRYYYDAINGDNYGRSILDGKLGLYDEIDETLSIASRTNRVSTPIEYIDTELLDVNPITHKRELPHRWDREYVKKDGLIDSDGKMTNQGIVVTQPKVNFLEYNDRINFLITQAINGDVSPATLGLELARKDNAQAQREKEKVTLVTRNNVIEQEKPFMIKIAKMVLLMQDYIDNPKAKLDIEKYNDITVDYDEFASPSFEEQAKTLTEMLNYKAISPKEFVEKLYRKDKTDEEKQIEIKFIEEQIKFQNAMMTGAMGEAKGDGKLDTLNENDNTPKRKIVK